MNEVDRLVNELRETHEGNPWHGSSVKEILSDVSYTVASTKPPNFSHSIWEMVVHLTTWMDIARVRLQGTAAEATPEEDWKPVKDTSKQAWISTLKEFDSAERALEGDISRLTDERLEEIAPGRNHTLHLMLQGVIYHSVYHSAQIAVVKKVLGRK